MKNQALFGSSLPSREGESPALRGVGVLFMWKFSVQALLILVSVSCTHGIYLHDVDLEKRLEAAKVEFAKVTGSSSGVWLSMRQNLDQAAAAESTALRQASETKRLTSLTNLSNWTWGKIAADAATDFDETQKLLVQLQDRIQQASQDLATLVSFVEANPGGNLDEFRANHPEIPSQARDTALRFLDLAIKQTGKVADYLAKSEDLIQQAEKIVIPKLAEYIDTDGIAKAIELVRKVHDTDLITDVQAALSTASAAITNPKEVTLPKELTAAASKHLGLRLEKIGDLVKLAEVPDPGLTEILLSLKREGRRTAAEIRKVQIDVLRERIQLYNLRLTVLGEKRAAATAVRNQASRLPSVDKVLVSLRGDFDTYRALNVAAEVAQKARDNLEEKLFLLCREVERTGSLYRWDKLTDHRIQVLAHREAIERAQVATRARERLVNSGIDGIIIFAEGGITEEQIANWIRVVQVAGLAVIGALID